MKIKRNKFLSQPHFEAMSGPRKPTANGSALISDMKEMVLYCSWFMQFFSMLCLHIKRYEAKEVWPFSFIEAIESFISVYQKRAGKRS